MTRIFPITRWKLVCTDFRRTSVHTKSQRGRCNVNHCPRSHGTNPRLTSVKTNLNWPWMKPVAFSNGPPGRTFCGTACLMLFLCFQLFAGVPQLHNWLHSDSSDAAHRCPLTLLTQGQVNAATNDSVISIFIPAIFPAALPRKDSFNTFDCRELPPGRAPPVA